MNEHSYIRRIHKKLPSHLFKWKIKDDYAGGVPDAWYCDQHGSLFVEYKYVPTYPKRGSTVIRAKLSELQRIWLRDRRESGYPVAVIVGTPLGSMVFDDPEAAYKGLAADEFTENLLDDIGVVDTILELMRPQQCK